MSAKLIKLIGRRIAERREARGLNRQQLSQRALVTWGNLQLYEDGRRAPTLETLHKICIALDWSLSAMLRGIEKEL